MYSVYSELWFKCCAFSASSFVFACGYCDPCFPTEIFDLFILSGFQVFFSTADTGFSFLLLPFQRLRRILDILRTLKTDHHLLLYNIWIIMTYCFLYPNYPIAWGLPEPGPLVLVENCNQLFSGIDKIYLLLCRKCYNIIILKEDPFKREELSGLTAPGSLGCGTYLLGTDGLYNSLS